jgi:hypothetical protein
LQELEKNFPGLATPESPTQRVGGAPSEKFARVKHLVADARRSTRCEASDSPTKDEEPDRDKRNRAQDENTSGRTSRVRHDHPQTPWPRECSIHH